MTEVVLFHHALGLTPGVIAFAEDLRGAGHDVHTPDLYEGRTFESLDAGLAHAEAVGFMAIIERGEDAVSSLPAELVYAGFSLGVLPAQKLAQTRPGARGALLYYSCVPVEEFAPAWPERPSSPGGRVMRAVVGLRSSCRRRGRVPAALDVAPRRIVRVVDGVDLSDRDDRVRRLVRSLCLGHAHQAARALERSPDRAGEPPGGLRCSRSVCRHCRTCWWTSPHGPPSMPAPDTPCTGCRWIACNATRGSCASGVSSDPDGCTNGSASDAGRTVYRRQAPCSPEGRRSATSAVRRRSWSRIRSVTS